MSAETATAEIRSFTFDTDFDTLTPLVEEEPVVEEQEEAEPVEEEFEEEIVPTFSEEELETAKKEAYEEGLQKGKDEAMATIQRETRDIMKAISLHITDLFAAQEKANNVLLRDGIGISTAMVRKMFPEMNRLNALGEVGRLIETTLMRLIEEPRIVVRVHADMHEALEGIVPDLKAGAGYEGRILLKDDPRLEFGDCRLEWGDGNAARMCDQLWESIDQIIEENTGEEKSATDTAIEGVDVKTGIEHREQPEAETPVAETTQADTPEQADQQGSEE